jgi:hypothetical protein
MGWDDNGLPTERRVQNYYGVRCDPALPYDPGFELPMAVRCWADSQLLALQAVEVGDRGGLVWQPLRFAGSARRFVGR